MKLDFKLIAENALQNIDRLLEEWVPGGKMEGREYVTYNPKRIDKNKGSFKINIDTGKWADYATDDKGGDLISLYAYLNGLDDYHAAEYLDNTYDFTKPARPRKAPPKRFDIYDVAPREPFEGEIKYPKMGKLTMTSVYRNRENNIIGVVVRFEREEIDKKTGEAKRIKTDRPYRFGKNLKTGKEGYFSKGWVGEKPIYNIENFDDNKKTVIFVEGEKCVNSIKDIVSKKINIITSQSGSSNVPKANFYFIKDKNVIIWRDNDAPGLKVEQYLNELLTNQGCKVISVPMRDEWHETYDCADFIKDHTPKELFEILKTAKPILTEKEEEIPTPEYIDYNVDEYDDVSDTIDVSAFDGDERDVKDDKEKIFEHDNEYFKILGHNKKNLYFLPKAKGQIVELTYAGLNQANLISLAPKEIWSHWFPSKNGTSWGNAADRLVQLSHSRGVFTPDKLRGRGAWMDDGNIIVHQGDKMLVNGVKTDPVEYDGEFIYERGVSIGGRHKTDEIATKEMGKEFIELCKMFKWKNSIHALYAAGWAYSACICSILEWRAHIWLTGEAGSGKTYFSSNVLKHFISGFGILAMGNTTEASIRQTSQKDGLPVHIEEAGDNDDKKGQQRLNGIIELMRTSSMPGEAVNLKGSSSGEATSFIVNSSFCLVSIVTVLKQQADQGRISIIEMLPAEGDKKEYFDKCNDAVSKLFKADTGSKFRNRAFKNILQILENIEVFRSVCTDYFNNKRTGDQVGSLLGSAFSVASDGVASYSVAMKWLKEQDWSEQDSVITEKDQDAILRIILQSKLSTNSQDHALSGKSVEDLIYLSLKGNYGGQNLTDKFLTDKAREALNNTGITVSKRVADAWFTIDANHKYMNELLRDTQYSSGYYKVLIRCEGAKDSRINVYNQAGKKTTRRGVKFDARFIIRNREDNFEDAGEETQFNDGSFGDGLTDF